MIHIFHMLLQCRTALKSMICMTEKVPRQQCTQTYSQFPKGPKETDNWQRKLKFMTNWYTVDPEYITLIYIKLSISYSCKIPLEISCKSIALYYAYIKLPFTATFNISNAVSLQVCFSNGEIITYHAVEALQHGMCTGWFASAPSSFLPYPELKKCLTLHSAAQRLKQRSWVIAAQHFPEVR